MMTIIDIFSSTMTPADRIGFISLNLSLGLYLILYLPQIIHNRNNQYLSTLSPGMHFILLTAYILDLFYGFSCHLQWQYKTVSIVSLSLLFIQHLQMTHFFWSKHDYLWVNIYLLFLVTSGTCIFYFFCIQDAHASAFTTEIIGYSSRLGFLVYTLPQIIKNKTLASGHALSVQFIYLNLTLSILDMISAWCLNWGWPNKLGTPIMLLLMFILLLQSKKLYPVTTAG